MTGSSDTKAVGAAKQGTMQTADNMFLLIIEKLIGQPIQRGASVGAAIEIGVDATFMADDKGPWLIRISAFNLITAGAGQLL